MSRPLDNATPTIYAPSAEASSSRRKSGKAILWESADLDEYDEGDSARSGSDEEEREEIDEEEVYGKSDRTLLECNSCTDLSLGRRSLIMMEAPFSGAYCTVVLT